MTKAICTVLLLLVVASSSASVPTISQAVNLARQYWGATEETEVEWRCRIGPLVDSTTPFIDRFTDRKRVWHVMFYDLPLTPKRVSGTHQPALRDASVFIDSATGNLVKIEFTHGPIDRDSLPHISAAEAERQLLESSQQSVGNVLRGVPDTLPEHSFVQALFAGTVDPREIKHVTGQYFVYIEKYKKDEEWFDTAPRRVWVLHCEGIPPLKPIGPRVPPAPEGASVQIPSDFGIPVYQRNRLLQIVNAATGLLRMTTNRPQPIVTQDDRGWPTIEADSSEAEIE